jgi:hypothetical protein
MCVVSMVADHYWDKWKHLQPQEASPTVVPVPWPAPVPNPPAISPEEVEEFRKLLERAREYDRKNSEPDCETAEKKARIKKLADDLGVPIDFL